MTDPIHRVSPPPPARPLRRAIGQGLRWTRRHVVPVALLALFFLSLGGIIVPVVSVATPSPVVPTLPHEASATLTNAITARTPTPQGVPAGLTPVTQTNHPCWPITKNGSACIQVDLGNYSNPDVIPEPPALNTSWNLYPQAETDIHFQVLSRWNLANCYYYNPPQLYGACSSDSSGPTEMYDGWKAYLYLTVVDTMWQDVCWFCDSDGTQWHANAGENWAPAWGHPYSGDAFHRWSFDLNISAYGGNGAENFPNGTWVLWNVTTCHWNGSATGPLVSVCECAPSCTGGGVTAQPDMFYYFTKDAFYYDDVAQGTNPPYGPQYSNEGGGGGQAFAANLNMTYYPVVPNEGDTVVVDLRTQPVNNISGGLINTLATILVLNAWYPNGTFWRTWASGFTPLAYPYNTTWHARLDLPVEFFENSGTTVQWFIQAYDQYGHLVQSRNFTQVVSQVGNCPNTNFTACLNLTSEPTAIDQEGWHGYLATVPESIPGIGINDEVNVTITTLNRSINIQAAYIIIHVNYSTTGGAGSALYTMHRITLNVYYFDIPALPEGSNVTFVVKAYDFNETSVISHPYRFFVPFEVFPPAAYCFFYVQVYNQLTNEPINGANITITGLAGTIRITTVTSINGVAYPNVTGQQWTPRFLPANNTYTIKVQASGFVGAGLPAPADTLAVNLYCTHVMNITSVLSQGPNYRVELQDAVLNFSLYSIAPPPIFSGPVSPGITIAMAGGMIAASAVLSPLYIHWRRIRTTAEAEEKRITL